MIGRLKNSHDTEENMTQNKRTTSIKIKPASNKHYDISLKKRKKIIKYCKRELLFLGGLSKKQKQNAQATVKNKKTKKKHEKISKPTRVRESSVSTKSGESLISYG